MARIVLALFVVFMLLTVLRGLRIFLSAFLRDTKPPRSASGPPAARQAEMVRDPVCGTWIDRSIALSAHRGGAIVPVCSEECRRTLERAG
jgi:YHS domain-containing protein